jgi:hypothetical protein
MATHTTAQINPMTDWTPIAKPVPPELVKGAPHATYPPPAIFFPPLEDRIDQVMRERLKEMFGGS